MQVQHQWHKTSTKYVLQTIGTNACAVVHCSAMFLSHWDSHAAHGHEHANGAARCCNEERRIVEHAQDRPDTGIQRLLHEGRGRCTGRQVSG